MQLPVDVYYANFVLTPEQRRFEAMLSMYPELQPFWNFQTCVCDIEKLLARWGNLSAEDREMARFFVTMWQPGNILEFNVMQAVRELSDRNWAVVKQWMATLEEPQVMRRMMKSNEE